MRTNFHPLIGANTSSNSIVRKLIKHADEDTKEEMKALIEGKIVEEPIHKDITYDEVYKTMDNYGILSFLLVI